jgi:predicted CXXCH cytochrome family protein
LFFSFIVLLVLVVFSLENQPHAFKQCSLCHVSNNPSGSQARQMTLPITMLCSSNCHDKIFSEGYMHPVDIRPQFVTIPADMPVSRSGELTCSTCHDVHADYFTPYGTSTHFLRRQEAGKAFCKICHRSLDIPRSGHKASLTEAHFRSQYIVTSSSMELDPMSKNCISCHDGSFAKSATIMAGSWTHQRNFVRNDRGSHPIGMNYETTRMSKAKSKTDLKPIHAVDRRIRFFDGRVGCGSCHDPYSTLHKKLVMSDEHSKLCLSCHMI